MSTFRTFFTPARAILAGFLVAVVGLAGCDRASDPAPIMPAAPAAKPALVVLATSDLKDVQPLAGMIEQATGVPVRFNFGGTMESTESVLTGASKAHAAWFANAKYLLSSVQGQQRVKLQEKIALSPIAVGVSQSDARRFGWDKPDLKMTWKDIAQAARDGKLRYALSNPATSNQGFMALMGVVAATSGKSEALVATDVDRTAIADFLKGYKIPGDNSTYLSEQFIQKQGTTANAFINYESWLLSLNASGKLREPLVLIYPFEGVSNADYPMMLLDDTRREDFIKVVAYLKSEPAQTWLARQTLRRPIVREVAAAVADVLPKAGLQIELPFSPDRELADGLIDAYLNEFRKPIASTFVLDTSGSMNGGGRRQQLVQALNYIAGEDASLTGRLARLTSRERVWLLPFAGEVFAPHRFEVPATAQAKQAKGVAQQADSDGKRQVLADIRAYADSLQMTGGTALYDATLVALKSMMDERARNPGYQYSVVVFTDGERSAGREFAQFKREYAAMPEDVRAIPVFWVLFGEANEAEMREAAKLTGGLVFDARKRSLYSVFKDIRAFQ